MGNRIFPITVRRCRGLENPVRNVCFSKKDGRYIVDAIKTATNEQIIDSVTKKHKQLFHAVKDVSFEITLDIVVIGTKPSPKKSSLQENSKRQRRVANEALQDAKQLLERYYKLVKYQQDVAKGAKIFESMPKKLAEIEKRKRDQGIEGDTRNKKPYYTHETDGMETFGAPASEAKKRKENRERAASGLKTRPEAFDKWTQKNVVFTRMTNG